MNIKETIKKFIPDFLLDIYHYKLALAGAFIYGFPAFSGIKIIGITGTSGKTTAVYLTTKILEEAGHKVASLSSIEFKIGNKIEENRLKITMPGRFKIQKFLRQAIKEKCQYAVLEVTSEGIKQFRHKFIDFNTAVFLNLSPEHIESHKGFENYRKEKLKLFKNTKNIHIVNLDDENAKYFLEIPAGKKWGYKLKAQISKFKTTTQNLKLLEVENIIINQDDIKFDIRGILFFLNLLGEFNIYNSLAAICIGLSQGISLETCKTALKKIKGIPGRMEKVINEPFMVIVDYAHTPDSLEKVYQTIKLKTQNSKLKTTTQNSKIICVLGACGGGRDKWKRPVLGKLAEKYCQEIIITNEDPYDENPLKIMKEIAFGIQNPKPNTYYLILDRREAIRKALELAKSNDIVIITGKGSEPWMCLKGGRKIPWDDRQIVKEEINKLYLTG